MAWNQIDSINGRGIYDLGGGQLYMDGGPDEQGSFISQAEYDKILGAQKTAASSAADDAFQKTGIRPYQGPVGYGVRDGVGGENATWATNPATGQMEAAFKGPGGYYFASDLINRYGSLEAASRLTTGLNEQGNPEQLFGTDLWSARPSNDTFSGKDGLRDLATIGLMAAPVGIAGLLGGAAGAAGSVGDAALAGGSGVDALSSVGAAEGLGSGLSAGTQTGAIGGGALGNGITAGSTTGGVGGGALGSGLGAASSGALAPGFFAAESLYPVAGGLTAGAASGIGGSTGASTGAAAGGSMLGNPQLLGAALGALSGGLGGSSQAGTTTSVQDIPEWLKPYALNMLGQATNTFNQMPKTSPVMGAAENEYLKTIRGDYLKPESNPYLQDTFNLGASKIKASISPTFGHMQAFGQNSGYNQAASRSIGEFATGLYGNNYNNERNRQFQATTQAPTFTTGGYEAAFAPYSQYKSLLGGFGSQTTSPYFENKTANLLGGAIAGMGLGRMFT